MSTQAPPQPSAPPPRPGGPARTRAERFRTESAAAGHRDRPAGSRAVPRSGAVSLAMPSAAALAVICASTAISGVVGGMTWLAYVFVVTMVLAATGTALRALRVPGPLICVGQVFVLLCLAVTLFTDSGVLAVLPGPTALSDLSNVLSDSVAEVQVGVPPVSADEPILCLVMVAVGLVAVAVDNLAVTANVPATSGLILLCVYAVPASLDDGMLPWWSFVLGASAFTIMLAVDGVARHQAWRGKLGLPATASTGVAPAAVTITALAAAVALFVGGTVTIVGTEGRLPGLTGTSGGGNGNLGISPFTKLAGMLDNKSTTELFTVSGLPANGPYLQALTLSTYVPGTGFVPDQTMRAGVPATGALPGNAPLPGSPTSTMRITPLHWQDVWLPVFGVPASLSGVPNSYHFDVNTNIVYSQRAQSPGAYTETADLAEPTAADLENAGVDYGGIDPKYYAPPQVNDRVSQLAEQITVGDDTEFDKAQAIYDYFRDPANGFSYSTQTEKPQVSDPLVDFLFYGKTGYCEQYATAMAVLLRTLGIPVRVAIGFTDGYTDNGQQVITSQDAHAWDEAYFPGYGWITFDPTPLGDGRSRTPSYLNNPAGNTNAPGSTGTITKPTQTPGSTTNPGNTTGGNSRANLSPTGSIGAQLDNAPGWQVWTAGLLALLSALATLLAWLTRREGPVGALLGGRVGRWRRWWLRTAGVGWLVTVFFVAALVSWWLAALVLVLCLAAAPQGVRELRRRKRAQLVAGSGPEAVGAAWAEVLAETWDRGTAIPDTMTLRGAAQQIVRDHELDDEGRAGLRTLVGAVERSWYGAAAGGGTDGGGTAGGGTAGGGTAVGGEGGGLVSAFEDVRRSFHKNAPLSWRARLLPRSVLKPQKKGLG